MICRRATHGLGSAIRLGVRHSIGSVVAIQHVGQPGGGKLTPTAMQGTARTAVHGLFPFGHASVEIAGLGLQPVEAVTGQDIQCEVFAADNAWIAVALNALLDNVIECRRSADWNIEAGDGLAPP